LSLHRIAGGDSLPVERMRPVVCIPVYGAYELFVQCLRSVLAHTERRIPVLVADDASPDPRIRDFLDHLEANGTLDHGVYYLRQERNLGFVGNINRAFEAVAPGDPVLLNSDCVVARNWLQGLRDAAYTESRVATASALTNHGTILSVPERNQPRPTLPQDWELERAASAISEESLRLRPQIPTALGHCVYIRRSALELVGAFDEAFSPGYGEEVDFSQRCLLRGLSHVVADDVFVFHQGQGSFSTAGKDIEAEHEELLRARYPYYQSAVKAVESGSLGPLPRALASARQALRGLSVTIDARILGPHLTGTQVVVIELVHALQRIEGLRVRALVPRDLGEYARALFDEMPNVSLITPNQVEAGVEWTDVVHRPFQVSYDDDLRILRRLGERIVISHLDLIAYENPGYFPSFEKWQSYRRITRQALAYADRVIFISSAAAQDAMRHDLIEPHRVDVVYPGTDHQLAALRLEPSVPQRLEAAEPFLLCIGTDYRHKNRVFALRVLEQLQVKHGWKGKLIFAGPHVPFGSSAGEEAEFLALRPEVAEAVTDLPVVSEPEKAWLLSHSCAVLYPTIYEGFGLIPFEAARVGVPCAFAPHTSLEEVLPRETAHLVAWDAGASADRLIDLINGQSADDLVGRIMESATRFSWGLSAVQTVDVYRRAVRDPSREATAIVHEAVRLEQLIAAVGDEGMSLLGPDAVLPDQMRRPLLAIATRPWLRGPIFGALRFPYRLGYRLRRARRGNDESEPMRAEVDSDDEATDLGEALRDVAVRLESLAERVRPPSSKQR
jgi:GT2 family glycosyltransferase/glycosyltransferase involved in cell wall biosynthesis